MNPAEEMQVLTCEGRIEDKVYGSVGTAQQYASQKAREDEQLRKEKSGNR
jgi:hypothetical protein